MYDTFNTTEIFKGVKNLVTIGIGGSFEGPKLLIESLVGSSGGMFNQVFITGSDSSEFQEKTRNLNPEKTLFVVSSKSFTTEETLATLNDAIKWSGDMDRFIAITANKSEASKHKIKHILEFDKEIGGRYSIWSDISLSAFYELTKIGQNSFFKGGYQADLDLKKNEEYLKFIKTLVYSDIWLHNFKNKTSRAVLSYSWKLRSFPDYVQQLEMESLGKPASKESEFKKTGQIIFGGYGPTAQHSYFQLLHQGTQEICADFIASKEDPKSLSYAQAITQARLLSNGADDLSDEKERINGNVPVNLFLLNKVDPFTLGYLIATWEHRTYITAAMLKINPFDQFGVSAGKTYTKRYLSKKD
jgi:glucose-6-phosphate isomerase